MELVAHLLLSGPACHFFTHQFTNLYAQEAIGGQDLRNKPLIAWLYQYPRSKHTEEELRKLLGTALNDLPYSLSTTSVLELHV